MNSIDSIMKTCLQVEEFRIIGRVWSGERAAALTELALLAPILILLSLLIASTSGVYEWLSGDAISSYQVLQTVPVPELPQLTVDESGDPILLTPQSVADYVYDKLSEANYPGILFSCVAVYGAESPSCNPASGDGILSFLGISSNSAVCNSMGMPVPCNPVILDSFSDDVASCSGHYVCIYNFLEFKATAQLAHLGFGG